MYDYNAFAVALYGFCLNITSRPMYITVKRFWLHGNHIWVISGAMCNNYMLITCMLHTIEGSLPSKYSEFKESS